MHIHKIRLRLAVLLEPKADQSFMGKFIDSALIVLILLNVIAVIMATVAEFEQQYGQLFETFNIFSVVVFTLEYALRVWTSVELNSTDSSPTKIQSGI